MSQLDANGKHNLLSIYIYMSLIKQTKIITLSSNDGISQHNQSAGYLSDLKFDFKNVINEDKNIVYNSIALHSVDMTNSFYNVNELNNKIDIKITILSNGAETNSTLNIPIGNYSASTFVIQFNAIILATSGKAGILSIDRNNGLFSLKPDANTYKITLLSTSTAYGVLGITANTSPEFTFNGNNTFNRGCNFLGITHLNIFSKALASDNIDSKSLSQNNLVAVIPVVAPSYNLITYDNRNEESILRNKLIGEIDLRITGNDGILANFNFIDWTITFSINTYRILEIDKILSSKNFTEYTNIKPVKEPPKTTKKKSLPTQKDKELDLLLS